MTEKEKKELISSWRAIYNELCKHGLDFLLEKEITEVVYHLRKLIYGEEEQ